MINFTNILAKDGKIKDQVLKKQKNGHEIPKIFVKCDFVEIPIVTRMIFTQKIPLENKEHLSVIGIFVEAAAATIVTKVYP